MMRQTRVFDNTANAKADTAEESLLQESESPLPSSPTASGTPAYAAKSSSAAAAVRKPTVDLLGDLMGDFSFSAPATASVTATPKQQQQSASFLSDFTGGNAGSQQPTPASQPPALVLQSSNVQMDKNLYGQKWQNLAIFKQVSDLNVKASFTQSSLEAALSKINVFVFASGTTNNQMKSYLYAKLSNENIYLFCELIIDLNSKKSNLCIKIDKGMLLINTKILTYTY